MVLDPAKSSYPDYSPAPGLHLTKSDNYPDTGGAKC